MSTFIELLRQHSDELERHYGAQFSNDIHQAIAAMLRCKTEQQGRSQWYCAHCQHHDRLPLSCGHRHCPQCQHRATSDWLERQKQKLLPVPLLHGDLHLALRVKSTGSPSPQNPLSDDVLCCLWCTERLCPTRAQRRVRIYHRAAYPQPPKKPASSSTCCRCGWKV